MKNLYIIFAAIALFIAACGKKEKVEFKLENIAFTKEGPFTAGSPETFSSTLKSEFADFLKSKQISAENISAVKLKSAEFSTLDSNAFSDFTNITISFTSGGDTKTKDLGTLAITNGKDNKVTVSGSAEANVLENFKSNEQNLVCDLNFKTDREKNFIFNGTYIFEIEYKK